MAVRVLAIPIAAHAADRRDALRAAIVIAAWAAVAGYGLLALAQGTAAIAAAFALASAFYTPIMPLADAYALRGLAREAPGARAPAPGSGLRPVAGRYGPIRLWGSAAFVAGSFGAGFFLDVIAARDLIWLAVAAMAATAAAALALRPLGSGSASTAAAA